MVSDYASVRHVTSNENGDQEVTLEYNNGLIRTLCKRPNRKETYVKRQNGLVWHNKETGKPTSDIKELEIVEACNYLKMSSLDPFNKARPV